MLKQEPNSVQLLVSTHVQLHIVKTTHSYGVILCWYCHTPSPVPVSPPLILGLSVSKTVVVRVQHYPQYDVDGAVKLRPVGQPGEKRLPHICAGKDEFITATTCISSKSIM